MNGEEVSTQDCGEWSGMLKVASRYAHAQAQAGERRQRPWAFDVDVSLS
jgi:hypothetical protein